jgi:hypothetical protein
VLLVRKVLALAQLGVQDKPDILEQQAHKDQLVIQDQPDILVLLVIWVLLVRKVLALAQLGVQDKLDIQELLVQKV